MRGNTGLKACAPLRSSDLCSFEGFCDISCNSFSKSPLSQTENNNIQMKRPDRPSDRRLRPLQIRRARKEDREAIWQIFRAVVREATLTSLTRTFHAGKRWLTGSVRKRAVTSLYRIKE